MGVTWDFKLHLWVPEDKDSLRDFNFPGLLSGLEIEHNYSHVATCGGVEEPVKDPDTRCCNRV